MDDGCGEEGHTGVIVVHTGLFGRLHDAVRPRTTTIVGLVAKTQLARQVDRERGRPRVGVVHTTFPVVRTGIE
jgi:hypothetical protein